MYGLKLNLGLPNCPDMLDMSRYLNIQELFRNAKFIM